MILSYILKFIKGFVRFELFGVDASKFLNHLMKENIYIWNISKMESKFYINISIKDYFILHRLSRGYKVRFKVKYRYGLPFVIRKHKKRIGIIVGLVFFISFLFCMSQFIWSIEINGNENVDVQKLEKFVASKNIAPGKFRKNLDIRAIERDVMLNFKEISWVAINIEGSKATVNINEVETAPEKIDEGDVCNIVAAKQGTIKRVEAYSGQNIVNIGDFVKEGQILVSGIIEDKALNNTPVHARAKAIAIVESEVEYFQPLTEKKITYKDISVDYFLKVSDKKIPINFSMKKEDNIKSFSNVIYPKFFNISLPFNIIRCNNKQPIIRPIKLSLNEAKNKVFEKIKRKEQEMEKRDEKVLSKEIIEDKFLDDCYIVRVKYVTEEDIARPQNIIFDN